MFRHVSCLGVIVSLGLAAAPARGEEATPTPTLREEEVLEHWLKNSPEVASWRTKVAGAHQDVRSARIWPNPEVSLSGVKLLDGTPPDGDSGWQGQLTVHLPVFGQIGARINAAERLVDVAEVNVLSAIWARAYEIQSAMVERAFADARLLMLRKNLSEVDRIEQIVKTRVRAGSNSEYDLLRVTTTTSTIHGAMSEATIARNRAEAKLVGLIADPSLQSVPITREGLANFRGPEHEPALLDFALKVRPDLELARRGALAAHASAERYRKDAIPTPSVFAQGYVVYRQYGVQFTGGISLPIPTFDRNQGQVGRALTEAQGQELLTQALATRVSAEVAGAWRARSDARAALAEFRERSLAPANELLRRAEVTYQVGTFSIAELFDAYQTIWQARSQELLLENQEADAEAELERAAGLVIPALTTR